MNDLNPKMQARVDSSLTRNSSIKKESTQKQKSPGNYVARGLDHGDNFSDFDNLKSIENNIKR